MFRDTWAGALQEVALARGPEELEALSQRAVLDGLASYLDSAEKLVGADLALMDPDLLRGEDRDVTAIGRARAEAEVNRYESENYRGE